MDNDDPSVEHIADMCDLGLRMHQHAKEIKP